MFDLSFGELAVIGTVALVVLGPERLPKVARTVGDWVGKAQRYVNQVKSDINREMELAELKKLQEEFPGIECTGIEIEETLVALAKKTMAGNGCQILQQPITALGFPDHSYDFVISRLVLEHLPEPLAALKEVLHSDYNDLMRSTAEYLKKTYGR